MDDVSRCEAPNRSLASVQAEKAAGEEALQAVQGALAAAQADGVAAHGEAATLAAALDTAEKARASLEADLALHVERHAAGMQARSRCHPLMHFCHLSLPQQAR